MEGYCYEVPVEVRWRDLDPLGHVNNAVFVSYLELARARLWLERFTLTRPTEIPFVIARVAVDYRRPVLLGEEVRVGLRVSRLGRASFTFEYRVEAAGELAAEAQTVQVMVDPVRHEPTGMPEELRRQLETMVCPAGAG